MSRKHSAYLLVITTICLVLSCAIVTMVTCGFYYRHSTSFWDAVEEHQFSVRDRNAEILLVGDSSLLFGVRPQDIRRQTGLSIYNLGIPMPALALDREILIARYVAHNRPPRLMVLYLSATTRARPPYTMAPTWYQGETMLIRYGRLHDIVGFFSRNADEVTRFVSLAARRVAKLDWSGKYYRSLAKSLDDNDGYTPPPPAGTMAQSDDCPLSSETIVPDREFIETFRENAAKHGIESAVYLAPIPDCDHSFDSTSSNYSGVTDNVAYTLPHRLFVDDVQRVHLLPEGAGQNTEIFGRFLGQLTANRISQQGAP